MFKLKLDLIITYTPPMSERGGGIYLTREIYLPFVPFEGLHLCGRQIDYAPGPEGFVLKDIIWDVDREVFLAHTQLMNQDLPILEIPADIKSWIELGWRLGSYADKYEFTEDDDDVVLNVPKEDADQDDWKTQLQLPTLSPRQRPKVFNLIMRALVRTMVEQYNDLPSAYAMDKTKRYFSEEQLKANSTKQARMWQNAVQEYVDMDWNQQLAWRNKVMRTHPRLDKLVEQL